MILTGLKKMLQKFHQIVNSIFSQNGAKAAQITPLIIEYIKANPKWQLSLQMHKYLNIP